jgi:F5/8 type C domain
LAGRLPHPTPLPRPLSRTNAADSPAHPESRPAKEAWSGKADGGPAHFVSRICFSVFDTGASTGDFPRGYTVQTSSNGTDWNTVVADGQGTGQFTTVDLPGSAIQYVRITLTTADPNDWWSVADVRASVAGGFS